MNNSTCHLGSRQSIVGLIIGLVVVLATPIDVLAEPTLSVEVGPLSGGGSMMITGDGFIGPKKQRAGRIIDVSAGCDHYIALTSDGRLYTWGNNDQGQLGAGDTTKYGSDSPYDITGKIINPDVAEGEDGTESIVQAAAGCNSTIVRTSSGRIYWWGNGVMVPQKMRDLHGQKIIALDVDKRPTTSAVMLSDKGFVYSWKYGDNNNEVSSVNGFGENNPARMIAISPQRSSFIVLANDKDIYTWRAGGKPQLIDYLGILNSPDGISDIVSVAAGYDSNGLSESSGNAQYNIVATSSIIQSWENEGASHALFAPDTTEIKQVLTDGNTGHYVLTNENAYFWYEPIDANGDSVPFIPFAMLPDGTQIDSVSIYPKWMRGELVALTDDGQVYILGRRQNVAVTPTLMYIPDDAEDESLISDVSIGDVSVPFTIDDSKTVTVTEISAGKQPGKVDVVMTDVYGNEYVVGSYTYQPPESDDNTTDSEDDTKHESNSDEESNETQIKDNDATLDKSLLDGKLKTDNTNNSQKTTSLALNSSGTNSLKRLSSTTNSGRVLAPNTGL